MIESIIDTTITPKCEKLPFKWTKKTAIKDMKMY